MANHYDFPDPNLADTASSHSDMGMEIISMVFSQAGVAGIAAIGLGWMLFRLVNRQGDRQDKAQDNLVQKLDKIFETVSRMEGRIVNLEHAQTNLQKEVEYIRARK
jgi:hypothetical protein